MLADSIAISDFPGFSNIDRALNKVESTLQEFVQWQPKLDSIPDVINARKFETDRSLLQEVLRDQYKINAPSSIPTQLIDRLGAENVFTICTAHQPCLFTGPAFVISKAISTIKLARQINQQYPQFQIIPFFVIGSEDHDLDELNHCYVNGKRLTWDTEQQGPVGRYHLDNISMVIAELKGLIEFHAFGPELIRMMEQAYQPGHTMSEAFMQILHQLLGSYGLLVLNMDDARLKKRFLPYIKTEIFSSASKPKVIETQGLLASKGFEPATYARDINFFYFDTGYRARIERENGSFNIVGQSLEFDDKTMLAEIENRPEKFSPNVIMRPIYQETILPNLAYIGGGGELAYWMERKSQFEAMEVPYPMLVRRDSFAIVEDSQMDVMKNYGVSMADLSMRTDLLINQLTESLSANPLDLHLELNGLLEWMEKIRLKTIEIDKTLGPSIEAEKSKLQKSIEHIEKKILKAEKSKLEVHLNRVKKVKEKLMPDGTLLERRENFMTFYAVYGPAFLETLMADFDPLDFQFKMIKINA